MNICLAKYRQIIYDQFKKNENADFIEISIESDFTADIHTMIKTELHCRNLESKIINRLLNSRSLLIAPTGDPRVSQDVIFYY